MLDYEWGNPSSIILSSDDPIQDSDTSRQILDHYTQSFNEALVLNSHGFNTTHEQHHHFRDVQSHLAETQTQTPFHSIYEPRLFGSSYPPPPPVAPMLSLEPIGSAGSAPNSYMVIPKSEPIGLDFNPRIGLNLGVRTYFSSSEDDYFLNRLYLRRSRLAAEPGSSTVNFPRCQAEGCIADLTHAKHYHRRHKVCEFHSKAATVIAGGLTQRFCQQCSRFHLLCEFDNGKRSCRKRLADHNRRRRKSHQQNQEHMKKHKFDQNATINSPSENQTRSPPDSGVQSTSSVTVAISPPRMSLDYCFQQRSHHQANTSSSASTCSLFFSNV